MTEPAPSSSALATASPTQITEPKAAPADISSGVFSGIAAFEAAQRMAQALCTSTMVPSEYRGQQGLSNSLIALEIAARMGLSPLVVMQNMTPIHGKPSWSSSFLIATVNASGRFTPGLIQSLSQAFLSVLSAWVEVGGIAPSLCLKAPPLQPIST